jgi:hypothetical protein
MTIYDYTTDFTSQLIVEPVTKKNWYKLVELFGEKGACGNCWCIYYRKSKAEFKEGKVDEGNKRAIKEII